MSKSKNLVKPLWEHGKVPPQAVDLEIAVLGEVMSASEILVEVSHLLIPEIFYKESHQIICRAIKSLLSKNDPVDILTVTNELKNMGQLDVVGGPYYISTLTTEFTHTVNTEYNLRILKEKYLKREMIRISSENIRDSFDDTTDVFDLIDKGTNNFVNLNDELITDANTKKLSDVAEEVFDVIKKTREDGFVPGIPSGLTSFDNKFHGFIAPALTIIASRPGMGKTALVLTISRNIVKENIPVALFSLEMSNEEVTQRLFQQEVDIGYQQMSDSTKLTDFQMQDLTNGLATLKGYPLYIDDTGGICPSELRAKAQKLVRKNGVKLIIIDYLQLMNADPSAKNNNRENEISYISRTLKEIAKNLKVPIIALSQLSRAVELRGGSKKPILSDLRESGAIEQDADSVIFLYRPEYYKIEFDDDGNDCTELAELIIAKHRNGSTGICKSKFIKKRMKFENFETDYEYVPMKPSKDFDGEEVKEDDPF